MYSLDVLLFLFGTSLLFHVQFCCFLTCIQVSQETGQVVWSSHLLKNFPMFIVIHKIKGFGIQNPEASPPTQVPSFASCSTVFLMMCFAHKLNKQGDNMQPWHTPFPIWNQSAVPCPVLLLPNLHIGFSRGRSRCLVFPSLEEFSTVSCDPHSQRLWYSQ